PLDDSVGLVPYSRPSPECSLRSPSNCRMSAARYSGIGAQAASANSARSPAANACRNSIGSREMAGRRRIPMLRRTSPGPTVRSRALCREYDGGGFVPRRRQDFCGQWSWTGGSQGRQRTGHKQGGADVLTFLHPFPFPGGAGEVLLDYRPTYTLLCIYKSSKQTGNLPGGM